jgi:hypothetical protein
MCSQGPSNLSSTQVGIAAACHECCRELGLLGAMQLALCFALSQIACKNVLEISFTLSG